MAASQPARNGGSISAEPPRLIRGERHVHRLPKGPHPAEGAACGPPGTRAEEAVADKVKVAVERWEGRQPLPWRWESLTYPQQLGADQAIKARSTEV